MKRWKLYLALSLIMCIIVVEPVWATTISDIKKDQKNTQKELDKVNDKISDLQEGQSEVQEEINELDDSLVEILASISMIEEDLEKNRRNWMQRRQIMMKLWQKKKSSMKP